MTISNPSPGVRSYLQSRIASWTWIDTLSTLALIFLGVVASGLWDVVGKPGVSALARVTLRAVTLGSSKIRDLPYASAALDPAPVPSLQLFGLVCALPGALLLVSLRTLVKIRRLALGKDNALRQALSSLLADGVREAMENDQAQGISAARSKRRSEQKFSLMKRSLATTAVALVLTIGGFVTSSVVNHASDIRRTFITNIARIAPFITELDEKKLLARFAQVEGREQYVNLRSSVDSIAKMQHIPLLQGEIW